MLRLLIAVDGSEASLRAVRHVIRFARELAQTPEVHLLNVQPALPSDVTRFVAREDVEAFHGERAAEALKAANEMLAAEGIPATSHHAVGHTTETIARRAGELGADQIVAGTRGTGGLTGILMGSVATRLPQASRIPVTLVP